MRFMATIGGIFSVYVLATLPLCANDLPQRVQQAKQDVTRRRQAVDQLKLKSQQNARRLSVLGLDDKRAGRRVRKILQQTRKLHSAKRTQQRALAKFGPKLLGLLNRLKRIRRTPNRGVAISGQQGGLIHPLTKAVLFKPGRYSSTEFTRLASRIETALQGIPKYQAQLRSDLAHLDKNINELQAAAELLKEQKRTVCKLRQLREKLVEALKSYRNVLQEQQAAISKGIPQANKALAVLKNNLSAAESDLSQIQERRRKLQTEVITLSLEFRQKLDNSVRRRWRKKYSQWKRLPTTETLERRRQTIMNEIDRWENVRRKVQAKASAVAAAINSVEQELHRLSGESPEKATEGQAPAASGNGGRDKQEANKTSHRVKSATGEEVEPTTEHGTEANNENPKADQTTEASGGVRPWDYRQFFNEMEEYFDDPNAQREMIEEYSDLTRRLDQPSLELGRERGKLAQDQELIDERTRRNKLLLTEAKELDRQLADAQQELAKANANSDEAGRRRAQQRIDDLEIKLKQNYTERQENVEDAKWANERKNQSHAQIAQLQARRRKDRSRLRDLTRRIDQANLNAFKALKESQQPARRRTREFYISAEELESLNRKRHKWQQESGQASVPTSAKSFAELERYVKRAERLREEASDLVDELAGLGKYTGQPKKKYLDKLEQATRKFDEYALAQEKASLAGKQFWDDQSLLSHWWNRERNEAIYARAVQNPFTRVGKLSQHIPAKSFVTDRQLSTARRIGTHVFAAAQKKQKKAEYAYGAVKGVRDTALTTAVAGGVALIPGGGYALAGWATKTLGDEFDRRRRDGQSWDEATLGTVATLTGSNDVALGLFGRDVGTGKRVDLSDEDRGYRTWSGLTAWGTIIGGAGAKPRGTRAGSGKGVRRNGATARSSRRSVTRSAPKLPRRRAAVGRGLPGGNKVKSARSAGSANPPPRSAGKAPGRATKPGGSRSPFPGAAAPSRGTSTSRPLTTTRSSSNRAARSTGSLQSPTSRSNRPGSPRKRATDTSKSRRTTAHPRSASTRRGGSKRGRSSNTRVSRRPKRGSLAERKLINKAREAHSRSARQKILERGLGGRRARQLMNDGTACFLQGTLVPTRRGWIAIENICSGDLVLSRNEDTGELGYKHVRRVFRGRTHRVCRITVVTTDGRKARAPRHQGRSRRHRSVSSLSESNEDDVSNLPGRVQQIQCTPGHDFYRMNDKSWVDAQRLNAGDRLLSPNGARLKVRRIELWHQNASTWNFEVQAWHTYFVADSPTAHPIWVHNKGCPLGNRLATDLGYQLAPPGYRWAANPRKNGGKPFIVKQARTSGPQLTYQPKTRRFINSQTGKVHSPRFAGLRQSQLNKHAKKYAKLINSNQVFKWKESFGNLTKSQRSTIRDHARNNGLINNLDKVKRYGPNQQYADFSAVARRFPEGPNVTLPRSLWKLGRKAHFRYLNKKYFGGEKNQPPGWTWHHMAYNGQMQLVPTGLHSAIDHAGGMSVGRWGSLFNWVWE